MQKILRHETLFGKITPLMDASHLVKERNVDSEIKIFKISKVIDKSSVFIGFGKPNVFVAFPKDEEFHKFDAKSFKRKPSEIVSTRDWAQSGLIIDIKNPTQDMMKAILSSSKSFEGSRYMTCVNANGRMLNRAGFTSGGKDLSTYYFPMTMAKQIIRNGLEFQGESIKFDIVKTMPNYLESFGLSVIKSQWLTFYRHFIRYYNVQAKKHKSLKFFQNCKEKLTSFFVKKKQKKVLEEKVVYYPENKPSRNDIEMSITTPSKLGLGVRMLCGPHAFYEVKNKNEKINELLPKQLKEYQAKTSGFFTTLKKDVLFSKPVVKFIRKHLANTKEEFLNSSEKDLYNMIRTDTPTIPNKYNLIITSESIYVIKIGIKYKLIDWILSKHVLLSGYSNDVRFAGEFWKEADGRVFFNNNSGTYAPTDDMLESAKTILNEAFPNTDINYVER